MFFWRADVLLDQLRHNNRENFDIFGAAIAVC